MPQAAITAIAGYLVTAGVSQAVALFVAKVFVYAASTYLLNRASELLAPKQRGVGLTGSEINYYDSGASIRIAYGRVRTGGMETIPPVTSGAENAVVHKVLTLTGHEIDSYNYMHMDTSTISNEIIGPMAFTSSDGQVTSGFYANHLWVRRYRGTSTDSADRMLMDVDSAAFNNARARGIAKVALAFKFNADIYRSIPVITFTYQGLRCYDPRLDSSPGANPTNASYIAWTSNPALCLCNYLMASYGGDYVSTDVDWDTVVTAANYCDAAVNIPGATTQARYTCNGVLFATDAFDENIRALVDSMLGRVIFRDGKWKVFAGSWQAPTFTIQKQDWIDGGLSIRFEQGRTRRFNRMRCWYIDPDRDWQRSECLPRSNATYKTADGNETIDVETEQLMCTNEYEAQRKTEFLLRQSRNQITVAGRLPPRFQNIALWDTGTIVFDHLGWASKTFRAVGIDMNPDGSMDAVFSEEQSTDWTDLDAADYNAPSVAALPATNVTTPSAPPSFSATPQINGTILFDWTTPIVKPFNTQFQIIRSTNSSNASVGTVVWQGIANPVPLVVPTSRHWYYVRAVANSAYSQYTPNTFGILGEPTGEADRTQSRTLVTDPELQLSSINGTFWGYERADVFSLSLIGGEVDGHIRVMANTASPQGNLMVIAMPSSPYIRNIRNRQVRFSCRMRTLSSISSRAFQLQHVVFVSGWTGVGSPCVSNSNMSAVFAAGMFININSATNGAAIPQNVYQDYSKVDTIGAWSFVDPASYSYLVAGIWVVGAGALNAGYASSGDLFEYDSIFASVL